MALSRDQLDILKRAAEVDYYESGKIDFRSLSYGSEELVGEKVSVRELKSLAEEEEWGKEIEEMEEIEEIVDTPEVKREVQIPSNRKQVVDDALKIVELQRRSAVQVLRYAALSLENLNKTIEDRKRHGQDVSAYLATSMDQIQKLLKDAGGSHGGAISAIMGLLDEKEKVGDEAGRKEQLLEKLAAMSEDDFSTLLGRAGVTPHTETQSEPSEGDLSTEEEDGVTIVFEEEAEN